MAKAQHRAEILFGKTQRAEARVSLVYGPYLTERRSASIATAKGAACTKLRRPFARPRRQPPQAKRGKVREFSRRSRTRLQQTLCSIPKAHVGRGLLFITMTYPDHWPGDWPVWKAQLDRMLKRMRRRFPRLGGTWKLEPQKRGAPHYHLLTVGASFIAANWLRQSWTEVLGNQLGPGKFVRVDVQLARSHRLVLFYAAKYVAKRQELPPDWQQGVGRWWGVFGRKNLDIVWLWAPLSDYQFWQATRIVGGLLARRPRAPERAPPRRYSSGMWAVLPDWQALRIAQCVRRIDRIGTPDARREYIGHPGQGKDCHACNR